VIVAQKRISAGFTTDSQRIARGWKWQRQYSDRLKCLCMFGQCAVVRNQRYIKSQLQRDRTRIPKAAPGNQCHAHALFACVIDCEAIALGDSPTGIEEGPVEIKSQETYRHKDRQGK
jgi:hypothetical protein